MRNRTDSWDFDIDQLLLGTMLFTLVAFLFPTVVVYYTLFATVSDFARIAHSRETNAIISEPTCDTIPSCYAGDVIGFLEPLPIIHSYAENQRSGSIAR